MILEEQRESVAVVWEFKPIKFRSLSEAKADWAEHDKRAKAKYHRRRAKENEAIALELAEELEQWECQGDEITNYPGLTVYTLASIQLGVLPFWAPELAGYMAASHECSWGQEPDEWLSVSEEIPGASGLPGRHIKITSARWRQLIEQHGGECLYCGASGVRLQRDHIVAFSKGGGGRLENVAPACAPCNQSKHAKELSAWLDSRPELRRSDIARRWFAAGRDGVPALY